MNDISSISDLNNKIRQRKYSEIRQDYSSMLNNLSYEKMNEAISLIENNIIEQFENSFPSQKSVLQKHIKDALRYQMKDIYNNVGFEYLFDRFSRSLFDIFLYPLTDNGRKKHFYKAKADFIYLDSYYCHNNEKKPPYSLIRLLLTQKDDGKGISFVIKTIDKIINDFLGLDKVSLAIKWAKKASSVLKNDEDMLKEFSRHLFEQSSTLDLDIEGLLDEVKSCTNLSDIIQEVNEDMKNIKDILKFAVVDAMDLDLVFFNSVDKNMDKLNSSIHSLVDRIVDTMHSVDAEQLEQKKMLYQERKLLIEDMKIWVE